ncbi:MAG: 50S ribosomal protein L10 [Candidatus Hodgkinia cicadicola]|nr:MAG: 50S ribosomal protein L10 [Candidatus Hodgkinia cicadicola]
MSVRQFKRVNFERSELIRLNTFIVLSAQAIDCNSILNLKRALRAHSAVVRVYRNASVRLALAPSYPGAFSAFRGQHIFLIIEDRVSEVCKLVAQFIALNNTHLHAFVCAGSLYNTECVNLIARLGTEAALRANVLAALRRVLSRFATALSLPLTNFAGLLTQALNNRCQK